MCLDCLFSNIYSPLAGRKKAPWQGISWRDLFARPPRLPRIGCALQGQRSDQDRILEHRVRASGGGADVGLRAARALQPDLPPARRARADYGRAGGADAIHSPHSREIFECFQFLGWSFHYPLRISHEEYWYRFLTRV